MSMKALLLLAAFGPWSWAFAASYTGRVEKLEIEGGCWLLVTDKGEQLEPVNLAAEFLKPGIRIAFEARPFAGGTICMAGRPVEVSQVVRLAEKGKARP